LSQPQPPLTPPPANGPTPGWAAPPNGTAYPAPAAPGLLPAIQAQPPAYPAQAQPQAFPAPAAYPGQAPAPEYQAPAYPSPVYAAQPAVDAGPVPGAYQAPQMQITACRFCGSVPAVATKFRGHQGMLVVMRFLHTDGPFCRDCGLGVFRHMTSRTLVQGWYGYASFVITPVTVLMNLVRRGKVAGLGAPQPNPYGQSRPPMNPGPPLLQRPMTWAGMLIPLGLIALLILAASTSN
jgi:hypothetical protein